MSIRSTYYSGTSESVFVNAMGCTCPRAINECPFPFSKNRLSHDEGSDGADDTDNTSADRVGEGTAVSTSGAGAGGSRARVRRSGGTSAVSGGTSRSGTGQPKQMSYLII